MDHEAEEIDPPGCHRIYHLSLIYVNQNGAYQLEKSSNDEKICSYFN